MLEAEKNDCGTEKSSNDFNFEQRNCLSKELWPRVRHFSLASHWKSNDGANYELKAFPSKLIIVLCNIPTRTLLNETINIWKNYVPFFEKLGCKVSFSLPFPSDQSTGSLIEEINIDVEEKLHINCSINESLFGTNGESYSLVLSEKTQLLAKDKLGLHRGIQTLAQIYSNKDSPQTRFQPVTIHDNPSFSYRALKINLSLNSLKIMKKETLHHLIEGISLLKFNYLHLICTVDPRTGTNCWPLSLSAMELIELDIFCSQWGISIVPELEVSPNSRETDLDTLREVYSSILLCFPQPKYLSLGPILLKLLIKNQEGPIQIESWTRFLPIDLNTTIVLLSFPIENLLEKDLLRSVLVLNDVSNNRSVNIQRNIISFDCSSKNSIGGCLKGFIPYVKQLIEIASLQPECLGILVNLTTDNFFLPLSLCLPGIISIAGLAWNVSSLQSNEDEESDVERIVGSVLNRLILQDTDDVIGKTIIDLAHIEAELSHQTDLKPKESYKQVSLLHLLLTNPDACEFDRNTAMSIQKGIRSINQVQLSLHRSQISCSQSGEILSELLLVADFMLLACRLGKSLVSAGANPDASVGCYVINAGVANLPGTARTDLANRLLGLMDQNRAVWLSRYCPNNLPAAMIVLQDLLNKLVPEDFAKEI